MDGEELITNLGFKYRSSCNCEGHFTRVYTKDLYELKWRSKRYMVKVRHNGTTIINWINISQLESTFLAAQTV